MHSFNLFVYNNTSIKVLTHNMFIFILTVDNLPGLMVWGWRLLLESGLDFCGLGEKEGEERRGNSLTRLDFLQSESILM